MCIGQFSVAGVVPVVIAGNAVNAYRIVAMIVALALVGFQMLTAFGIREKPRKEQNEELSLKDMYRILQEMTSWSPQELLLYFLTLHAIFSLYLV